METLVKSIAIVLANAKHYQAIDKYAREMFSVYCDTHPKEDGTWRGYYDFEIIDLENIQINFVCGASDMEYDERILVNINTNEIKEN